jgi:hypothetical protein
MSLGTMWTAPGEGATVNDLKRALTQRASALKLSGRDAAFAHLITLSRRGHGSQRTNLTFRAGEPLQEYDTSRIEAAEVLE